jgi:hypothetical protein
MPYVCEYQPEKLEIWKYYDYDYEFKYVEWDEANKHLFILISLINVLMPKF